MSVTDLTGLCAALLVLAAFSSRRMIPLRVLAILSNLAFIGYGVMLALMPIWSLHATLLVVNIYHLVTLLRQPEARPDDDDRPQVIMMSPYKPLGPQPAREWR